MDYVATVRKALVPAAVGLVLVVLARFHVTPDMSVRELITLGVTAGLVYLTPNKK